MAEGVEIKITEKKLEKMSDALASKVVRGEIPDHVAESAVRGWAKPLFRRACISRIK